MPIRPFVSTILLVALALFLTLPFGNGPLLPFFLIGLLLHFGYQGVRMLRHPEERPRRRIRLLIWGAVALLAAATQGYWAYATRSHADAALQGILAYQARLGSFPTSLGDAGLDEPALRAWGIRYVLRDGKPQLSHPATLMWLGLHEYDFAARSWRGNAE